MNANGPDTLFALQNAALRIRDRRILEDTTWTVSRGEHWVVIGPNGAGKTTLLNSVTGQIPVVGGSVYRRRRLRVGLVGPELYRRYLQDEARRQVLWSPVTDSYPVTTARMVIEHRRPGDSYRPDISASGRGSRADPEWIGFLAAGLGVSHLLDRPVGTLSTGEMRKVLLISAMAGSPDLLLLDEPFDGLDLASREWFADAVSEVIGTNTTLILATHREDEIVAAISRYAELSDGRMVRQGPVDRSGGPLVPGLPASVSVGADTAAAPEGRERRPPGPDSRGRRPNRAAGTPMIEVKDIRVRYGGRVVLDGLSWTMHRGENWCITGPNGCGKTTLLNLVSGDHLQAYSNNIRLFGKQRGTGESIWDIKHHIGHVTPYLQARHDSSVTARDVVLSGFFDSIGLYRYPSGPQTRRYDELASQLGIGHLANSPIDRLSAGQRTLVMIARAMIKEPEVLILDEPCDGLDPERRAEILGAIETIGSSEATDLVYVTHRREEIPACVTHHLDLASFAVAAPGSA